MLQSNICGLCATKRPCLHEVHLGSTGKSKRVLLNHRALCTSFTAHGTFLHLGTGSRVLQFVAFTFDISVQDIFTTLARGGCVCLASEEERLGDLTVAMKDIRVNWACLAPSVAAILRPNLTPTLQTLVLAGEPIDK